MHNIELQNFSAACKCRTNYTATYSACDLSDRQIILQGGMVYGVKGDIQKAWALPYTLTGNNRHYSGQIKMDGVSMKPHDLRRVACYIGRIPWIERRLNLPNASGYELLNRACKKNPENSPDQIISMFELGENDFDRVCRRIRHMGNVRFSLTAALGYARKKSLYCLQWTDPKTCPISEYRISVIKRNIVSKGYIMLVPSLDPQKSFGSVIDEIIEV